MDEREVVGGKSTVKRSFLQGQVIDVDGINFENVVFTDCVLRYSGGELPGFSRCLFSSTRFHFDGPAGRALAFLQALASSGGGLDQVVKAAFPTLFPPHTGTPQPADTPTSEAPDGK